MGMSPPEWSRYLHDQLSVPLAPEQINELVIAALLMCHHAQNQGVGSWSGYLRWLAPSFERSDR